MPAATLLTGFENWLRREGADPSRIIRFKILWTTLDAIDDPICPHCAVGQECCGVVQPLKTLAPGIVSKRYFCVECRNLYELHWNHPGS